MYNDAVYSYEVKIIVVRSRLAWIPARSASWLLLPLLLLLRREICIRQPNAFHLASVFSPWKRKKRRISPPRVFPTFGTFRAAENLERPRRTSLLSGERLSTSRDWTLGLSIGNRDKIWELFVRLGNFIVAWKIFRFFFLLPNF